MALVAHPSARSPGARQAREWGRYEWLGTSASARDDAPDEGYVHHPE